MPQQITTRRLKKEVPSDPTSSTYSLKKIVSIEQIGTALSEVKEKQKVENEYNNCITALSKGNRKNNM